jgi:hypothetical protein
MILEFTKEEKEKLDMDIEDLDISVRAYNCLKSMGIKKLRTLLTYSLEELRIYRYVGVKSLAEIEMVLEKMGLHLRNSNFTNLRLVKEINHLNDETWFLVKINHETYYYKNESDARQKYDIMKRLETKHIETVTLDRSEIKLSV